MTLAAGTAIGPYVVEGPLNRGAMAHVYEAHDPVLDRRVALKLLTDGFDTARDPEFAARFEREARIIASLNHDAIVPIFGSGIHSPDDSGAHGDIPWMAMRLVRGGNLSALLREPLVPDRIMAILDAIAGALDYAHSMGVIHRDVKPENILLETVAGQEKAYLTDFGIALAAGASAVTHEGVVFGTPKYMAPEHAAGRPGPLSDVYSLGIVAYEMYERRTPFNASDLRQLFAQHAASPVPDPSNAGPVASKAILICLAKDPERRWQSAQAFVAALAGRQTRPMLRRTTTEPLHPTRERVARVIRHAVPHSAFVAALAVAGYVLSQGFSWGVIGLGLLSAACLVALGLSSRRLGLVSPRAAPDSRKPLASLRLAATLAAIGSVGALVTFARDEPRGGRIVIQPGERSTAIPEALFVQRGLTSHRVVAEASRFTLAGIRCGDWRLRASGGVQPAMWTVSIPASGDRTHEVTTDFHRRLARVHLRVTDSDAGSPLDARIVLQPAPYAPVGPIRTEASGFGETRIELGTYGVTVSSTGYEPVDLASFSVLQDGQVMAVEMTRAPQHPQPPPGPAPRRAPRTVASTSTPQPASGAGQLPPGADREGLSPTYDNLLFNAKQDCRQDPQVAIRFIEVQLDNPRFFLSPRDRERAAELLEQIKKGHCP